MSGTIVNNITRTSGTIAPTTGGLSWGSDVITGSTATVSAGNGYWINTTSNACTVTLPSSAEIGDQIILADYARTWSTNNLIIDSNGNNFQGETDAFIVDYSTAGQSLSIVYSDATKGWIPVSDDAVAEAPVAPSTQKGIFGYGASSSLYQKMTNLVSNTGVVATDVSGVDPGRQSLAAASYGGDKAIFAFGVTSGANLTNASNLVNNSGVVQTEGTGVGTVRRELAAVTYGGDKAIFGFGYAGSYSNLTNKVNNSGVIATDTTGVGSTRANLAATTYGSTGQALFGYGDTGSVSSLTNLISNTGVVSADVTGVGTARGELAACAYGGDKGIFGYGVGNKSMTNLVSNTGVVAADVSGVGTGRNLLAACAYGGDKGVFGYGHASADSSLTNLVSNTGVVASDTTGVGTARRVLAAVGFSYS